MDKLADRLTLWALRTVATLMLLAGVSMLVAGLPLLGVLTGSSVVRTIAFGLLQLSGVFMLAGAAARYLSNASNPHGPVLPNERSSTFDRDRPGIGGWLFALAIVLVALPAWLVLRLQAFLTESRRVAGLLAASELWENANANMSGIVLVPLFGALTPPFLELATTAAFVVASAVLLVLLLLRTPRFPRTYLACVVLLSGLVLASHRSADTANDVASAAQDVVNNSSSRGDEAAQIRDVIGRYTSIVTSTVPVLVWTLCGYLVWVPAMFSSRRVMTTFARRADRSGSAYERAADLESITAPPRFPG
jgi:hypothetical protein